MMASTFYTRYMDDKKLYTYVLISTKNQLISVKINLHGGGYFCLIIRFIFCNTVQNINPLKIGVFSFSFISRKLKEMAKIALANISFFEILDGRVPKLEMKKYNLQHFFTASSLFS
jgi:hypothetical protein